MTSRIVSYCFAALTLSLMTDASAQTASAETAITVPAPIVFFDIAGPDTDALRNFYNAVFGWNVGAEKNLASPLTVTVGPQLQGILRKESASHVPPNEVLLYLGVADITKTREPLNNPDGLLAFTQCRNQGALATACRQPV